MTRRVVITGLGIVSPLGNTPDVFFNHLMAGQSGVRRLQAEFADQLDVKIAAQAEFAPLQYFTKNKASSLDRVSQFALYCAAQAITDAQLDLAAVDKARIGVYLGSGMGGAIALDESYERLYRENATRLKPFTVLMAMMNASNSHLALEYGFSGPNLCFSTACSSATIAIGEAFHQIQHGRADLMFSGGSEALLTYGTLRAWEALRTLAKEDATDLSTSCKPFSKDRSGLVLGEGAGILILEEMEHAQARGAKIYAEITGFGTANDSGHMTSPSVEGQSLSLRAALASSGLQPKDIDYINAHGTGTALNDIVETGAIKNVFGDHAYKLAVSSTKSMHGHLMGASGAVECIATVKALEQQAIPPTMHLQNPDPECDLDYVPNQGRKGVRLRHAMSNSFAFGGTGGVLVLSKT